MGFSPPPMAQTRPQPQPIKVPPKKQFLAAVITICAKLNLASFFELFKQRDGTIHTPRGCPSVCEETLMT